MQSEGLSPSQEVISGAEGFTLGQLLSSHHAGSGCGPLQQLTCLLLKRGAEQGAMSRTGQAGSMGTSIFLCLLIILLTRGSPAACAGDNSSATHSK